MSTPRPHYGSNGHPPSPPTRVDDWEQLDQDIDEFIRTNTYSPRTVKTYKKGWAQWRKHCKQLGVDPLDAPMSAFEDLWTLRAADGRLYSAAGVANITCAVAKEYEKHGRTPAFKQPENTPQWRALVKGRKKQRNRSKNQDAKPPGEPLMRDALCAMLNTKPSITSRGPTLVAAILTLLDSDLTQSEIPHLTRSDVIINDGGSINIKNHFLPCEHTPRALGVPWDCSACAVRDAAAGLDPTALLFPAPGTPWKHTFYQARRNFSGLEDPTPLGPSAGVRRGQSSYFHARTDLSTWQTAGLRRALVLSHYYRPALRWLRARAWVAMSWSAGLRMGGDLTGLNRDAISPDDQGRGWVLQLGASKGDQTAARNEQRPFPWGDGNDVNVAGAVADYACVRDAYIGPAGPMLVGVRGETYRPHRIASPDEIARDDIELLTQLAGLTAHYTSYSTRRGYATQASRDGWDIEDIQAGLRHAKLSTSTLYTNSRDTRQTARKLVQELSKEQQT